MVIITILFVIILMIMFYTLDKVSNINAKVSDCERNSERYRNLLSAIEGVKLQICENFNKLLDIETIVGFTNECCDKIIPPVEGDDNVKATETKFCNKKNKKNKKSNNKK